MSKFKANRGSNLKQIFLISHSWTLPKNHNDKGKIVNSQLTVFMDEVVIVVRGKSSLKLPSFLCTTKLKPQKPQTRVY